MWPCGQNPGLTSEWMGNNAPQGLSALGTCEDGGADVHRGLGHGDAPLGGPLQTPSTTGMETLCVPGLCGLERPAWGAGA